MLKGDLYPRTKGWAILWNVFTLSFLCVTTFSCSNELHMLFPEGPEGPAGKSAYEVWVDGVNDGTIDWPEDRTDMNNFFLYLNGEDGKDGVDGKSAYEIWIAEVEAGLDNPKNPGTDWPKDETDINDFWYYLTGADGEDGVTPNIGENGNWWVNGEDTGIPAQGPQGPQGEPGEDGEDGEDGQDGQGGSGSMPDITIGDNGNWFINGEDTGKPAQGEPGNDGKSAYELWVEDVKDGGADKPGGGKWDEKDGITIADFWEFLRGPKGEDGEDGKDGQDGMDGTAQVKPVAGKYNVIAMNTEDNSLAYEYVAWATGLVKYQVYGTDQQKITGKVSVTFPANSLATGAKTTYTGTDGVIFVPNTALPDKEKDAPDYFCTVASLEVNGSTISTDEIAPNNTYVPSQVHVRLRLSIEDDEAKAPRFRWDDNNEAFEVQPLSIDWVFERKIYADSEWEIMPNGIDAHKQATVYNYTNGTLEVRDVTEESFRFSECTDGSGALCVDIPRKVITSGHLNMVTATTDIEELSGMLWGDNGEYAPNDPKYITIGFDGRGANGEGDDATGCYGQQVLLRSADNKVILMQDVPAQPMPMPTRIVATDWQQSSSTQMLTGAQLSIYLDKEEIKKQLNADLCFERYYEIATDGSLSDYTVYKPVKYEIDDFLNERFYCVHFIGDGSNGDSQTNTYPITAPSSEEPMTLSTYLSTNMTMYLLSTGSYNGHYPADNSSYNFMGYPCATLSLEGTTENPKATLNAKYSFITLSQGLTNIENNSGGSAQ